MTVKAKSLTTLKTTMIRSITCTTAIAGAAVLPLALPPAAPALTVGQTSSNVMAGSRGQSFRPSVIGSDGTGTPPASGNLPLNSITFAYTISSDRTAPTLYIYTSVPTLTSLDTGTGALYSSSSFSDSSSSDARFGHLSRTFNFTGAVLDVNTTYYALFAQNQNLRLVIDDLYTGGTEYYASGSFLSTEDIDTAFIADFTPTPIPFAFNPLLGVGGAGLLKVGKALRDRLRNRKSTVS